MLKSKLKELPDLSGIYKYYDENGKILYIGKAKSLKKRVKSYFRFTPEFGFNPNQSPRILKMLSEVVSFDYILTNSELDALILENSLIKQLKPKYNILLRDDKTYPYIYIDFDEKFPRFRITRKLLNGKNIKYFGPFVSGANAILEAIYEMFKLKQSDSCKKLCLYHQIDRCLAPCEGLIDRDSYILIVQKAMDYILNLNLLIEYLQNKMLKLSNELKFEEALNLRDSIKSITFNNSNSNIDLAKELNLDIFSLVIGRERAILMRLFVRDGKVVSTSDSSFKFEERFDKDEILKNSLIDFYSKDIPLIADEILISDTLSNQEELLDFLYTRFNKKIKLTLPKRGIKKNLLDLATLNAKELLKERFDSTLDEIYNFFKFQNYPKRIEIFDNSSISNVAKVGAMVVFDSNKFDKSSYRIYNLESDFEYEQMRELLIRRTKNFEIESPPDLWIIDGGSTLLSLAYSIIDSLGVNIDIVAISKEKIDAKVSRSKVRANDKIYSTNLVYNFKNGDKKLLFFQRLRDEAHRFALKSHQKLKLRLDSKLFGGLNKIKIKKLINNFGSFENIKSASRDELLKLLNSKDIDLLLKDS